MTRNLYYGFGRADPKDRYRLNSLQPAGTRYNNIIIMTMFFTRRTCPRQDYCTRLSRNTLRWYYIYIYTLKRVLIFLYWCIRRNNIVVTVKV